MDHADHIQGKSNIFFQSKVQQMQVMEKRGKPCGKRQRPKAKDYYGISNAKKYRPEYKKGDEEQSFDLYNALELDY